FMAHGTDAALGSTRVRDAAKRRGDHVAMLEGRGKVGALFRVVSQPVQQLGEAPFRRIDAATPVNCGKPFAMGGFGDFRGFGFGAMIAPEIVVVERPQTFVDGYDRGASGVESQSLDGGSLDAGT